MISPHNMNENTNLSFSNNPLKRKKRRYKMNRRRGRSVRMVKRLKANFKTREALPMMAYTGRLCPKGVPFSGFRCVER